MKVGKHVHQNMQQLSINLEPVGSGFFGAEQLGTKQGRSTPRGALIPIRTWSYCIK